MALIAVGGMQHETNVFGPSRATFDKFEMADEWPPLCRGDVMLEQIDGINLPAQGAVEWLRAAGHEILPLLWCSATPSAQVSRDAFERIVGMLLEDLARAPGVDGVLLDLHGAMVCEHIADGDGELLRRVRAAVGERVPVVATLDLHANVSRQMAGAASVLEIYRSYPHVDMAETGRRAAAHVDRLLRRGLARYPAEAFRRPDFLIPPVSGCTLAGPAAEVYARLAELVGGDVAGLSLACGFPAADVADAAPAIVGYGFDAAAVNAAADDLLDAVVRREDEFRGRLYGVEDGVRAALDLLASVDGPVAEAIRLSAGADGPVILADSQDNPGGGGLGDTTEILRELVSRRDDRSRTRRAQRRARLPPFRGAFPGAGAGRRPFRRDRPDARRRARRPRPERAAGNRRRQGGGRLEAGADDGPGDVPPPRRRAGGAKDHRDQEQHPLPQRFRRHRRRDADDRRARAGDFEPGRAAAERSGADPPGPQARRPA